MTQEEFIEYSKNINRYKLKKRLAPPLDYAEIADSFHSDTLYEAGYNILELVNSGFLDVIPQIFPFEKDVVGKNIYSVITVCPQCGSHGVNFPLEKECGNCGYTKTRTYYDAQTIQNLIDNLKP